MDPPGVGARDLQECLLIQLRKKKKTISTKTAEVILEKCFESFKKKHYKKIEQKLDIDTTAIKDAMAEIVKLNPKPGNSLIDTTKSVQHITPDFTITENEGTLARIEKELEITNLQDELRKFQTKKFGVGGDLFRKRKELIQPIQRKVFKAIQSLAKDNNYAYVLDKSKNSNILYADPKYDKSDAIIRKLKK